LWSSAAAFLVVAYGIALPVAVLVAPSVGRWLRLPEVGFWHPGTAIVFVYVCVAARAVLITGNFTLFAAGSFREAAALSLGQALASNMVATAAAWRTHDLVPTLASFWFTQVLVVALGWLIAQRRGWQPRVHLVSLVAIRRLLAYGTRVQLSEWAQIINFQFDKFVIVRVLGLWPAARYEVANRSVLALRSIPSSGMDTFLPVAAPRNEDEDLSGPRRMSGIALYGVILFLAAPLAVAPVFLYAWVGEMGYVSRHVFAFLALGATANLLSLPLAALAQAAGRPEVQARAAAASILLNIPRSLFFVRFWGVEGAALGSALAMILSTAILIDQARTALGSRVVSEVLATIGRYWSLYVACLAWGAAVHLGFRHWFEGTSVSVRYGWGPRAMAAGAALLLYIACVLTLAALKLRLGSLTPDERRVVAVIASIARIRRREAVRALPDPRR
jgi:O-antigen/teichoic acid export membrane protein